MKENVKLWEELILSCSLSQDVLLSTMYLMRIRKEGFSF